MFNLKVISAVLALSTIATSSANATSKPTPDNVLGLFLVKKDLLTQQWRGEIYPIAQLKNGQYIDASVYVADRDDTTEAELVQQNAVKSILNQPSTFTAINAKSEPLTQLNVNQLGVGQFACESRLIGRGSVANGTNLAKLYDQLPSDRTQGVQGTIYGKPVHETWRWTLATQKPLLIPQAIPVSTAQFAKYRADLVKIGTAAINQTKEGKAFAGKAILEELQTMDLDGDGKLEVYAKLYKGKKTLPRNARRPTVKAVYANIWLKYNGNQPQVISKQVIPHFSPASDAGREYTVLQAIDLDQDGKSEVLIRNNGYEGVNFSIYQLQGNQLKSVFTGAGYGC